MTRLSVAGIGRRLFGGPGRRQRGGVAAGSRRVSPRRRRARPWLGGESRSYGAAARRLGGASPHASTAQAVVFVRGHRRDARAEVVVDGAVGLRAIVVE